MSKKTKLIIIILVIAALVVLFFFAGNLLKKGSNGTVSETKTTDGVVGKTLEKPIRPTRPLIAPPPPKK